MPRVAFRPLALFSALLCCALAVVWIASPQLLLWMWNLDMTPTVALVARRNGAVFAGIAVMLYRVRDAAPSPARAALVTGLVVGCALLALLGSVEWATGNAGAGILAAVAVEVALALALLRHC